MDQWRSQGGATASPIATKTILSKRQIRREIGGGDTRYMLKDELTKYVSTAENDDILEEPDL